MADPDRILADTLAAIVAERGHTDRTDSQLMDRVVRAYETYRLATQRPDVERGPHCDDCGSSVRSDWQKP